MNEVQRICAYYSHGPHYTRLLKHLRATYPAARIVAVVPPAYPADTLRELAHETLRTAHTRYSLASPGALFRLIGDLRRVRADLFVVMFDSPKLRLLAHASGARQRRVYTIDGRLQALEGAIFAAVTGDVVRRIRGHLLYARLWCIVHFQRVEK